MKNKRIVNKFLGGIQRIDTTRGHARGTRSHDVSENEKSSNGNQLPLNIYNGDSLFTVSVAT